MTVRFRASCFVQSHAMSTSALPRVSREIAVRSRAQVSTSALNAALHASKTVRPAQQNTTRLSNIHLPHELCTTLRNGSLARLRSVPIPWSHQNLAIASILLRHGLISNVTLGSHREAHPSAFDAVPPIAQRIWCELKYREQRPVLGDMQLVSKPSKRVFVSAQELAALLKGQRSRFVEGARLGEIFIVAERGVEDTKLRDVKYWDGREAVMRNLAGELVARARSE